MDIRYRIVGGTPLNGSVQVGGSKNAALPLLAGTVLVDGVTVLENVPRIRDTVAMAGILEFLGAKVDFTGNTVRVDASGVQSKTIPHDLVSRLRGSIVLLGPLLSRFGVVEMDYPGGCVLGKRPVAAHIMALTQLGAQDMSNDKVLHLQGTLKPGRVVLPEFSVTATENAVLAAARVPGESVIDLAAAEPHVQDVCRLVQAMGAEVEGIGTHRIVVRGTASPKAVTHRVVSDYLEVGAFCIAALVTRGNIELHDAHEDHLTAFLGAIHRIAGDVVSVDAAKGTITVDGTNAQLKATAIQTNIFPGFPTDLQSPMGVLLTQAEGVSRIFEVLFEGRMAYLYELEKMGAHIEILNSHQALVIGPKQLRGRTVASNDIRAGTAMVMAALCAEGETVITDVHYIERGYDKFDEKLRSLGAVIERSEIPSKTAS